MTSAWRLPFEIHQQIESGNTIYVLQKYCMDMQLVNRIYEKKYHNHISCVSNSIISYFATSSCLTALHKIVFHPPSLRIPVITDHIAPAQREKISCLIHLRTSVDPM